jgi:hypothetical protein
LGMVDKLTPDYNRLEGLAYDIMASARETIDRKISAFHPGTQDDAVDEGVVGHELTDIDDSQEADEEPRRGGNEFRPPAQLTTPVQQRPQQSERLTPYESPADVITCPLDDGAEYPECFKRYANPVDRPKLLDRWQAVMAAAVRESRTASKADLDDPARYLDSLLVKAEHMLKSRAILDVAQKLSPFQPETQDGRECEAILVSNLMDTKVWAKISKFIKGRLTWKPLRRAMMNEIKKPKTIFDLLKYLLGSAARTNFSDNVELYPQFRQEFDRCWQDYAAGVGFSRADKAEMRKVNLFAQALPAKVVKRLYDAQEKLKNGADLPDTWEEVHALVEELCRKMSDEADAAQVANEKGKGKATFPHNKRGYADVAKGGAGPAPKKPSQAPAGSSQGQRTNQPSQNGSQGYKPHFGRGRGRGRGRGKGRFGGNRNGGNNHHNGTDKPHHQGADKQPKDKA